MLSLIGEHHAELAALLGEVKGVGKATISTLLAEVPELGELSGREVSALVGVAPIRRAPDITYTEFLRGNCSEEKLLSEHPAGTKTRNYWPSRPSSKGTRSRNPPSFVPGHGTRARGKTESDRESKGSGESLI
jgi:hypothetical protein